MSCLFNSLSFFLDDNSHVIRQNICDYLENNKPVIDGLSTDKVLLMSEHGNNYVNKMRSTSTWGGAIEIQAACNIWNVNIHVINIRDNTDNNTIEFNPVCNKTNKTISITWNGGHYEPVK